MLSGARWDSRRAARVWRGGGPGRRHRCGYRCDRQLPATSPSGNRARDGRRRRSGNRRRSGKHESRVTGIEASLSAWELARPSVSTARGSSGRLGADGLTDHERQRIADERRARMAAEAPRVDGRVKRTLRPPCAAGTTVWLGLDDAGIGGVSMYSERDGADDVRLPIVAVARRYRGLGGACARETLE